MMVTPVMPYVLYSMGIGDAFMLGLPSDLAKRRNASEKKKTPEILAKTPVVSTVGSASSKLVLERVLARLVEAAGEPSAGILDAASSTTRVSTERLLACCWPAVFSRPATCKDPRRREMLLAGKARLSLLDSLLTDALSEMNNIGLKEQSIK